MSDSFPSLHTQHVCPGRRSALCPVTRSGVLSLLPRASPESVLLTCPGLLSLSPPATVGLLSSLTAVASTPALIMSVLKKPSVYLFASPLLFSSSDESSHSRTPSPRLLLPLPPTPVRVCLQDSTRTAGQVQQKFPFFPKFSLHLVFLFYLPLGSI